MPTSMMAQTPLSIPTSPGEITPAWLQQALQPHFPQVQIEQLSWERVGEGFGLASQIYRMRWTSGPAPHSIIVKLWSTSSPSGVREIDFYATLADPLRAWIPACYFGGSDLEHGVGALVLDEISPGIQGDCLLQLPPPLAEAAARSLAGIHAAWFQKTELQEAAWLPVEAVWRRDVDWFVPRRTAFLQRFGGRIDPLSRVLLERIETAVPVANQRLAKAPLTLLHGDLHLDNYIFAHGKIPVLLDWAGCVQGPLALDLYDLLFSISTQEDIQAVFDAYLAAFKAYSGQSLDAAQVWRQLGGAFLRKFATTTCGAANWQPATLREAAMIETGLDRTRAALLFWRNLDPDLFAFLDQPVR